MAFGTRQIIYLSLVAMGSPCRPRSDPISTRLTFRPGSAPPVSFTGPKNLCRARPRPTLYWEILQALGITACFQHLYLKSSSVACPWVCLLWLLSVCCKGAELLHQLLLPKCWPWGPRLFFCLTIFTCFLGPQQSLRPSAHFWQLLSQGPFQLWTRWDLLVAEWWGPRTLEHTEPRGGRACPRAQSAAT